MQNLYRETVRILAAHGKEPGDVDFVSTPCGDMTWAQFAAHADFEYYSGYGCANISTELMVVGKEPWWLERYEYDGSERFVFKTMPLRSAQRVPDDQILASIMN